MQRGFWKATLTSVTAYVSAILLGFWIGFWLSLFAVLAIQVTWTLFCVCRLVQLRIGGGYKITAEPYERDDYGFALGGALSSLALLIVILVLTQAV
jgi:hypothetical protein